MRFQLRSRKVALDWARVRCLGSSCLPVPLWNRQFCYNTSISTTVCSSSPFPHFLCLTWSSIFSEFPNQELWQQESDRMT